MDATYINTKPHVLRTQDARTGPGPDGGRGDRHFPPPPSDAGLDSGVVAATSAESLSSPAPAVSASASVSAFASASTSAFPSSSSLFSPSTLVTTAVTTATAAPAPFPSFPLPKPPSHRPPPSVRSTPATLPSHRRQIDIASAYIDTGSTSTHTAATTESFASPRLSFPPLFFSREDNTQTETKTETVKGKSIPLDNSTAEYRTSALRELSNNFPSPVFHHYAKSASAENATYSHPVIVRTYSGPSHSPSSSAQFRNSSRQRNNSRAAGSSSRYATGSSYESSNSLFGMARSKVTKSLMPWHWTTKGLDEPQRNEPQLPPLEAFSYKGFMTDLQATTDIRRDLDRIAEICARSRYSLSNAYDNHVAPHGSGAGFVSVPGVQPPYRSTKGGGGGGGARKQGSAGVGGPTLQAVPSDEEESTRGHRRRRGGGGGAGGGGRRRSAAYGTLETIMSSSRSSEEDKTKKKPAGEIAEDVRGRAAKKASDAAAAAAATKPSRASKGKQRASASSSGSESGSRRGSPKGSRHGSRHGSRKGSPSGNKKGKKPSVDTSPFEDGNNVQLSRSKTSSPGPEGSRSARHSPRRRRATSFAHAVIDSNRQHQPNSSITGQGSTPATAGAFVSGATVELANDLSMGHFDMPIVPNGPGNESHTHNHTNDNNRGTNGESSTSTTTTGHGPKTDTNSNEHGVHDAGDETAPGFLLGLSNWIPWAGSNPAHHQRVDSRHVEDRLRELLKTETEE